VATLTLAAVLTEMDVVLLVTGQAVLIELDLIGRLLVAAGTLQFSMRAPSGQIPSPCRGRIPISATVAE